MPDKHQAMQKWLETFSVPVYAAGAVPCDAEPPYITYTASDGVWGDGEVNVQCDLWYRTESEAEPNAKVAEMSRAIGRGGVMVACDGGGFWVKRGTPFAQAVADTDTSIKRRYINLSVEYMTEY